MGRAIAGCAPACAACTADPDCGSNAGPGTCNDTSGQREIQSTGVILLVALNTAVQGNLGGVAGADARCAAAASAAGASGTWQAFLADSTRNIEDLSTGDDRDKPVYNNRGELVLQSWGERVLGNGGEDLPDEVLYSFEGLPIAPDSIPEPDSSGGRIWSGAAHWDISDDNCNDWTSNGEAASGNVSQNLFNLSRQHNLMIAHRDSCDEYLALLCVGNL